LEAAPALGACASQPARFTTPEDLHLHGDLLAAFAAQFTVTSLRSGVAAGAE
jgi:hypothetical protein